MDQAAQAGIIQRLADLLAAKSTHREVRFGRFEHGLRYFMESVERRIA